MAKNCPECNAKPSPLNSLRLPWLRTDYSSFACDSVIDKGEFEQSDKCYLTVLESQFKEAVELLREARGLLELHYDNPVKCDCGVCKTCIIDAFLSKLDSEVAK